jgi:hypothetical protein
MIPALFTSIFSLITGFINGRLEVQKAKIETDKAAQANKARLLADTESNNQAWQMAALTGADVPLRRICFAIFSFPFIYAAFDPMAVKHYFDQAIAAMPTWYVQTYMGMVCIIWGVNALKDPISQIISHVRGR